MVEILEGANIRVDAQKVIIKGPNGEVQKIFPKQAQVKIDGKNVDVIVDDFALKGTLESLINNMFIGVTKGYKRNFKILHAHFPASIEVKGTEILIKNFLGEKFPRKTRLIGPTKMEVKGQNVTLSGPDKESIGQTITNLRNALKIKKKDARTFQDGIYEV